MTSFDRVGTQDEATAQLNPPETPREDLVKELVHLRKRERELVDQVKRLSAELTDRDRLVEQLSERRGQLSSMITNARSALKEG